MWETARKVGIGRQKHEFLPARRVVNLDPNFDFMHSLSLA